MSKPDSRLVAWFRDVLDRYQRVAVAGGPRMGKTTIVECAGDERATLRSDDVQGLAWEEIPSRIIEWSGDQESFVVEGVMVSRALRKGLTVDAVVWLEVPVAPRAKGQKAMAKACRTILNEWRETAPEVPVLIPPRDFYGAAAKLDGLRVPKD